MTIEYREKAVTSLFELVTAFSCLHFQNIRITLPF